MWRDKAAVNRVRMLWRFDSFLMDQFWDGSSEGAPMVERD